MGEETGQRKILIVDDEAAVRRTLERIVNKVQRKCMLASSAEEARSMLKEEVFDLILCDIRLPGESGLELITHTLSEYPQTAVIMVSGVEDPEVAKKALDMGAYGYIIKPFRPDELVSIVEEFLRTVEEG